MDELLGTFLVILFVITIIMSLYSPCGGSIMVTGLVITFLALLFTNPDKLGDSLTMKSNSNSDNIKETIIGSETPLNRDRLESRQLQKLTQDIDKKEIDVSKENKAFKHDHPNLDNSVGVNAILSRDNTPADKYITGDELLAHKMAHVSVKNRNAIHNRTRFTSDNFRKYFQEELDESEDRHWWENDLLEAQT